ncbi:hypothetical protein M0R72_19455 [Candidatus Pacearchaeota archaeon]|jgi:hypothetical protein|nr:hypothetical protein [Candidatus Pacearchaeota archaeon]
MSIDALRYDAITSGMRIEACLQMILDAEDAHRATADDLSEAWYLALQKYASPEEALAKTTDLFDKGYNLDMVKCVLMRHA